MTSLAASVRELADAPDAAALATTLGRVAVPALGDVCMLYLADAAGALRPTVSPSRSSVTALSSLYDLEARSDRATAGYRRVMQAGRPVLLTGLSDADLEQLTESPEHRAQLQAAGFASLALAPLTVRGTAAGLLVVGSIGRSHEYDAQAVSLLELLASVTAATLAARALEQREAGLRRRLDELSLAARELAHLLNNVLTMPVGAVEILLDRPDLDADLREILVAAANDLTAAEHHVRAFHQLARGEAPAGASPAPSDPVR